MARRSKLTPELREDICRLLRAGNWIVTACEYVGIAERTFYLWIQRGERGWKSDREGGYVQFMQSVKKARAEAEARNVGIINKAANDGTWQAAAWYLERSAPDRWGRRVHDVNHGGSVSITLDWGDDA